VGVCADGIGWPGYNAEAIIRIFAQDGTIEVSTSACLFVFEFAYLHKDPL
jgi:hypothetical protein